MLAYDQLLHLSNRRKYEYELQRAIDIENNVGILFLDLDRFKYINDSLGHRVGDKLIVSVAKRLKDLIDNDTIVLRQGGDEFTILVKGIGKDNISKLAKDILDHMKKPFIIDQHEILITCSIGISLYPEHGKDIETLMKNADAALYWVKENGKDNYSIYEGYMIEKSANTMELELELRKAVENQEFILHYQPKIDLNTEEIVGCEALIRWDHPRRGIISPEKFIPLAEETGLINQIGEWVLREACKQNKKWHDTGWSDIQMAVNMSVSQLKQSNIVTTIESLLSETQLDPRFLEIEITESISMVTEEEKIKQLFDLKEFGISLAIDDFGTGYSSLKYLNKLPVDTLKIDKYFIDEVGMSTYSTSSLMVNAIISLAKSLNLKVVAEGIETQEQMKYLKKHQCDIGQGYFLCKPLPADELEKFFKR